MFVWVEVFALIVGFLCACGVRRLYDLRRVCLYFASILPLFCPLLSSFVLFLVLYFVLLLLCLPFFLSSLLLLLSLFLLSSACPLGCLASALGLVLSLCGLLLFLFPLRMYAQKERAQSVFASSLVLLCVALFGCCFIFLVLVWCQPVYIVIEF